MYFLFVDETGDPGANGSECFGLAVMQVNSKCYDAIRRLLFSFRLLSGMFPEIKHVPQKPIAHLNLLRGIGKLADAGLIEISGIYINKSQYGGRYLHWVEDDLTAAESDWPYYLRNYLLRHLLEIHFAGKPVPDEDIDLVLDRILLSEAQRENTLSYLNSFVPIRQPFALPAIKHLTIADSQYIGALQLTHILTGLVKNIAKGNIATDQEELAHSLRIAQFVGHLKME